MPHGYSERTQELTRRLERIEGQVLGLSRMIGEEAYCIDVLTQLASVTKSLQSVGMELLSDHLRHCVQHAAPGTEDAMVEEAVTSVKRLLRS